MLEKLYMNDSNPINHRTVVNTVNVPLINQLKYDHVNKSQEISQLYKPELFLSLQYCCMTQQSYQLYLDPGNMSNLMLIQTYFLVAISAQAQNWHQWLLFSYRWSKKGNMWKILCIHYYAKTNRSNDRHMQRKPFKKYMSIDARL